MRTVLKQFYVWGTIFNVCCWVLNAEEWECVSLEGYGVVYVAAPIDLYLCLVII